MANKTLEQLYLEREHQKRETEGAPESTRVALSAASGRNILKTKEETAKLRRDEEIASAQVQAAIDKNSAAGAVTLAKAQNSADLQEEKRAFDMEKVRRNEAIAIMNMGIYDPSFAGLLGMDDSTIRRATDRKASEIAQAKAKRAAAQKAQADYEAALKNLQNQRDEEKKRAEWYETKIDREIAAFEADNKTVEDAEAAKKKIVENADVEKVFIPWATPTQDLLMLPKDPIELANLELRLNSPDPKIRAEAAQSVQERLRKAGEQLKREKEAAQQNKARAMAYYDEAITKKIKEKEAAGEELSALESAFKSKMQDNFGALLTASKFDMENASTAEEQEKAYRAYGDFLYTGVADTLAKSDDLIELAQKKKNNAEQLTDDEQSAVEAQIEAVEQIAVVLRNELKTMDFTIEQQDLIDDYLQRLEGSVEYLQAAKEYYTHYEENKDALEYAVMDQKYGTLSAEELLAQIEYLKSGKYDTSNERKQISKKGMAGARAKALSDYEEKTKLNAEIDAEIQRMERYLERKNDELRSNLQIETGREILALTGGANLAEQFKLLIESDGVVDDALGSRSRVTLKDYNPGGLFDPGSPKKRAEKRAFQEQKADGTMAYLSLLAPTMEEEFKKENLRPGAWLEAIKLNTVVLQKYNNGREETYRGKYSFEDDILSFKDGEYGIFTQEEALRTLAVYARYGPDVAFDYYATVREDALLREADKLNEWGAAGMGMVSGITRFATHGAYMLGNALEQSYARIGGDIMSASHQVTMENLDRMGMGGDILEFLYMSGYTVLDMVPAVVLSTIPTVGQAAASGYIFAKTMANTYTDSIARGKRADEALTFSILSATSEVAMERIIGGISGLGSKNSLNAKLKVAIENLATTSRMKTILKIAGSMGAEGFEEFLQEVVSPFLGKIAADLNGISDAELEQIDWEEAAKSFALGAITGGIFDGISGYSDYRRGNLRAVLSYNSLQDGSAVELINIAAEQGNKRAVEIKSAMQSETARYQGRDGLFAYASVHDMNNIRKSIKRRSNRAVQNAINAEMDAAEGEATNKGEIKRIFNKILNARSLTFHEAAALINDPQGIKIFERLIGEDTSGLMPDEVAYLARLASFVDSNGKVSKARLDLFRDAFGELDYKALKEIIKYNDMVGMHVGGILYENPSVEDGLTATEAEAVEAMKELSKETGTVYLITDEHQTGTFLASNLLAVNRADLNQGVYYLLAHEAYFKTKQLDPELGAKIKDFLLEEIEQMIGADGMAAEIKKIRQQEIVDGEMIDEDAAKDELCARMMPAVFLQGNYAAADRLAETNIEAATLLRKTLGAIREHLAEAYESFSRSDEYDNIVDNILKDESFRINEKYVEILSEIPSDLCKILGIDDGRLAIKFTKLYALIRSEGNLVLKKGKKPHYHSLGENFAKNIALFLTNPDEVILLGSGEYNIIKTMDDGKLYVTSLRLQKNLKIRGKNDNYNVIVTAFETNQDYIESKQSNEKNTVVYKKSDTTQVSERARYVPNAINAVSLNNSISNSFENVNGNLYHLLYESVGKETTDLYDRLTQLIKEHRTKQYGWRNGDVVKELDTEIDPETLPAKVQQYIKRAENELMSTLGIYTRGSNSEWVQSIVQKMADEYLLNGEISEEGTKMLRDTVDSYLFEETFDAAFGKFKEKMRIAERYVAERMALSGEKTDAIQSVDELREAFTELKTSRKKYERAKSRNLLVEQDEQIVGRLIRGDLTVDEVESKQENAAGIREIYEARLEYERVAKKVREYITTRKAKLREEADAFLKNANEWRDKKSGIWYSRETMERNLLDITSSPAEAQALIDWAFKPVHDSAAAATNLKNEYRERVKKLKLSTKVKGDNLVSESHAVQLLGEAQDNIRMIDESDGRIKVRDGKTKEEWEYAIKELWESSPGLNKEKIQSAVNEFGKIYDELFEMMNDARIRNGYEPVNYRNGYFPHFQPGETEGVMASFAKALGIRVDADVLPTTINGLTHTFRPGIQWFGNSKERLGFATAYDAVEGFDRYIEGVANVIHQTDNIQRLRALSAQIRYRTSDAGLRKQIDEINADTSLAEEDRENRIEKIHKEGRFTLSNFVNELDEYTNLLANKKSNRDRGVEQDAGRRIYGIAKALESRVAANMIAGNISSALTNFIPLQMAGAEIDTITLVKAQIQTLSAYCRDDGFVAKSSFLTNRRGSDPLVRSWSESAAAVVGKPMEWIDRYVADTLIRARYMQNVKRGLSEDAAMAEADAWASGIMADRSKGSMPTIFERRNPLTKLFTQFQLEVNNQYSYLFKDLPRRYGKEAAGKLALALLRFCIGAFLFNDSFEKLFGRRPAFDPLGILNDALGDYAGYSLPNVYDFIGGAFTGNMPSLKTEKQGFVQGTLNVAENVAQELPFVGGLLDGGRFPISSAMPNWENLFKSIFSEDWDSKKKWYTFAKEMSKPMFYLVAPFAGGQLKKMAEGTEALVRQGSYSVDSDGEDTMQYSVDSDDFFDWLRTFALGKSSTPEAQEWVENDFDGYSATETAEYKALTNAGIDAGDAAKTIRAIGEIKNDSGGADKDAQRRYILGLDMTDEQKYILYKDTLSESATEKIEELIKADVDWGTVMKSYVEYRDIEKDARFEHDEKGKATEFAYYLDTEFSDHTKAKMIKDSLTYGVLGAVKATEYEEMVSNRATYDEAYDVFFAVSSLEPEEGEKNVKAVAKYRKIDSMGLSEKSTRAALLAYASDSDARRMTLAFEESIDSDQFVSVKKSIEYLNDLEGKNTASNARIEAAIRNEKELTDRQRAVLWQLFTSSDSAKNNPFSVSVGAEMLAKIEQYKASEE